jgi:hypothetical protein
MNHRMAAWNVSPLRTLALRTGRKISKTGIARQWIMQRPEEDTAKRSAIRCTLGILRA